METRSRMVTNMVNYGWKNVAFQKASQAIRGNQIEAFNI